MHLLPWEKGPELEPSIDRDWHSRLPDLNNKWAFLGQVGWNIVMLVLIAILFGLFQQFSDYLNNRGEFRDQEAARIEQQQRDLLCELISGIPAPEDSELYQLNAELECRTTPLPADPGASPSEVPPVPDSTDPTTSTDGPSTDTGDTQQSEPADDTGAAGTTAPPVGGGSSGAGGGATSVPTPVIPTRTTTAPTRPTQSPAPAPQPQPTTPPPAAPSQGGSGIVPGVDVQLCLPLIGCVNV